MDAQRASGFPREGAGGSGALASPGGWAVSVEGFRFTSQIRFAEDGTPKAGTSIFPSIRVERLGPPLAVGRPRLRIARLIGFDGKDLIDHPLLTSREYRYVRPAPPEFTLPHWNTPGGRAPGTVLHTGSLQVALAGAPRGIATLDGSVEFDVITRDVIRDVVYIGEPVRLDLAPGVEFRVEPSGSGSRLARVTCTIDPGVRTAEGPPALPHLNLVERLGPGSREQVHLQGRRRDDGLLEEGATIHVQASGATALFIHLVLETETVRVPLRIDDLEITGCPGGDPARRAATAAPRGTEGIRLARVDLETEYRWPAALPARTARFTFEIAGRPTDRLAVSRFRIDEMTDEDGRPLRVNGPFALNDGTFVSRSARYENSPEAAGSRQWPNMDANVGVGTIRLPLERYPARIGRVRGEAVLRRRTGFFTADVPLDRRHTETEIAPGIRVRITAPDHERSAYEQPQGWVTLHIDDPAGGARPPEFLEVQYLGKDGAVKLINRGGNSRRTDGATVITLGSEVGYTDAEVLRFRFASGYEEVPFPFELFDLPCAELRARPGSDLPSGDDE